MRDEVRKEQRAKKIAKHSKGTRKRKPVFFSDAIEVMFNKMPKECQEFIIKGK